MERKGNNPQDQFCKLFIGGLSPNTTMEIMKEFYEQFGTVTDAVVMKDKTTNRSRCFGFVTFAEPESVDQAQANRPHNIDGKDVDSKRAVPRDDGNPESRFPTKKIFVGGLKREVTKEQLDEYFSQYGVITESNIVTDKATGVSKGFGFVTFDDTDSVDKAIIYRPHSINGSKADVKKGLSKEEMAQAKQKQAQYQGNMQQPGGYYGNQQGGQGYYQGSGGAVGGGASAYGGNAGGGGAQGWYTQNGAAGGGAAAATGGYDQGGWGQQYSSGVGNYYSQGNAGGGAMKPQSNFGRSAPYNH